MLNSVPKSEVFNVDCLDYMKGLPDNHFQLSIIDPPYGINAPNLNMGTNPNRKDQRGGISTATKLKTKGRLNSGGGKLKNRNLNLSNFDWDNETPSDDYWSELFRISKNQIICGGNYFDLPPTRGIVCWDKCQPWTNFSQWEMIWTSFDCPAKMFRYSNTGGNNFEIKIHPTQKPVALYKYLLTLFAKKDDLILDTHLGSGSSRIAAYDLGFDFVGCELNKDYFDAADKRFQEHINQPTLFEKVIKKKTQENLYD
jgi:site-specific DNA-methyltransferase (adenine-specific)